jgi:hypothetical protein
MTFVSEIERRQVMEECFSGHMSRNCKYCPAHPDNGGSCCFGSEKFDDADDAEDCPECIHRDDCQGIALDREAEGQHFERYYRRYSSNVPAPPRRTVRLPVVQSEQRRVVSLGGSGPVPSRFTTGTQLERPRSRLITTVASYPTPAPSSMLAKGEPPARQETLFHRFFKDFVWGALQGAFEMGVEFFRGHRLP